MVCAPNVQCVISERQVTEGFLAAPPMIDEQILDLTIKHPSWTRDLPKFTPFPLGQGTEYQQIIFRGEMPPIERGFAKWKQLSNNSGCNPCPGPDCSYNITNFGGTGLERKATRMMSREFRSPSYCIKEVQTTYQFEQVIAKIIENLYAQTDFFKDQNVTFNALTELAKKFIVDSGGAKPNPQNPYVYRPLGATTRISGLNIEMLEFFYEWMRHIPDVVPYDVVNGAPIYSLIASHQTLARLYRDDPQSRQDVRFSGLANDMLMKYNFMSTIRGMFIAAPILYPRRFNITVTTGEPVEVLPYVNGIPMEVGSFTGFNPGYEAATHEEVIIHGKYPFEILYMPTAETMGSNTSFGPEFSWLDNWAWINPLTETDPFRRLGFFITSATIGIAPQFSEGIFAILVERPKVGLMASWLPEPVCPPTPAACGNEVPAVLCPCPLITGYFENPVDGSFIINLAVPIDVAALDTVQFGISTGGYLVGTVVALSADGKSVQVTFPAGTEIVCDNFTSIFCDNSMGCYSDVIFYAPVATDNTRLTLTLSNPVKGDPSDSITVYYGDGTSATVTLISQNYANNTVVIDVGGTAFSDTVCGVIAICIPTAADATCPGCGGASFTQCET